MRHTKPTWYIQLNTTQTKLQQQLKTQQDDANKRAAELNESIKKMQETNGSLQKSLSQLTSLNTQAAKDLDAAKDRARELERQLEAARKGNGSNFPTAIAVTIAAVISFFAAYLLFGG